MFVQTSFPNKLVQDKFFSSEQLNLWGQGGQGHMGQCRAFQKSATVKESRPEELDFADVVSNIPSCSNQVEEEHREEQLDWGTLPGPALSWGRYSFCS